MVPPVDDIDEKEPVLFLKVQLDAPVVVADRVTDGPVVLPETGDVMLTVGAVASTVQVTLVWAVLPTESVQLT